MTDFGYAGKILRVDLTKGTITTSPTAEYADRFLGGRGLAAKIYWDEVTPETKAFDPDNRLIFATGPLSGITPGIGGVRWVVCGKSPATTPEQFSHSNLGGNWGTELKRAGFDAVVVHGKSNAPCCLVVDDGRVELQESANLKGKTTLETRALLKEKLGAPFKVLATGPAGENRVSMATILSENDASGTGGFGAVMGSKNLKAIAVKGTGRVAAAQPDRLAKLSRHIREIRKTSPSESVFGMRAVPEMSRLDICRGCSLGCQRLVYEAGNGREGKFICGAVGFYQARAARYYGQRDWREVPFAAAMLANDYGVDCFALGTMMMFLSRASQAGLIDDANTGIPLSKMGSIDFIETLVKKMSTRDGFGDILADGTVRAAEKIGKGAEKLLTDYVSKAEQGVAYDPRYYITTGLLYAMEPRQPIQQLHEVSRNLLQWLSWMNKASHAYVSTDVLRAIGKRFWGTELGADLSTYEGKAQVAVRIQDRQYVKESAVLCDWIFPVMSVEFSDDHVGDPTLENQIMSAALGREIDERELYRIGERVVNLQRAILTREARGSDTIADFHFATPQRDDPMNPKGLAPGKDGEVISRKGAVLDRAKFDEMKREFYALRGWDRTSGLQTRAKLESLDLKDVADKLAEQHLLA